MSFADCHVHTLNSHDSESSPCAICETAVHKGLQSVAFTDHFDTQYCHTRPERERIFAYGDRAA